MISHINLPENNNNEIYGIIFYIIKYQFHCPNIHTRTSKLRSLICNNFGRRKNDPAKDRKALATYVGLRGYTHGGNRKSRDQSGLLNLDEIGKELNTSTTNLKRALRIERNLTDSMKELLDTGEIIK